MSIVERDNPANSDFNCLQFAHIGDTAFACRLPHEALDEVIVELKPRSGQALAGLTRWLLNASIASDSLLPLIQRYRLPGALRRPLSAAEILERHLRPQAAMFVLQNQEVAIEDKGAQPVFQSDQSLFIQGEADLNIPAAIILYFPKAAITDA